MSKGNKEWRGTTEEPPVPTRTIVARQPGDGVVFEYVWETALPDALLPDQRPAAGGVVEWPKR